MTEDRDQAAERAAVAARNAVKEEPRHSVAGSFLPIILVAAAILSAVYLFTASPDDEPRPTDAMPVPHVQAPAPGSNPQPTPPAQN